MKYGNLYQHFFAAFYSPHFIMEDAEYASLRDAVQMLQRSVDFDSTVVLEVRRSHILKDTLREARKLKFTTTKLAKVTVMFQ